MNRLIFIICLALVLPTAVPGHIFWSRNDIEQNFDVATSVYAIDLDKDGDDDVLGASYELNEIVWWENDGNGNFSAKNTISSTFNGAQCVYAADLDNDGDVDVLGASYELNEIVWWENNGASPSGTIPLGFSEQYNPIGFFDSPIFVYAIDLDGDSYKDVLATGINDNSPTWWKNDGNGNFIEDSIPHNDSILDFSIIDLDGDTDVDIVATNAIVKKAFWYENDGNGNFIKSVFAPFSCTDKPGAIHATDLDSDGDVDVLISHLAPDHPPDEQKCVIDWWKNDGNMNFTIHRICSLLLSKNVNSIYATDLDGDIDVDIVVTAGGWGRDSSGINIAWLENDINDSCSLVPQPLTKVGGFIGHIISRGSNPARSGYATDLDNDGNVDILAAYCVNPSTISWWKNNLGGIGDVGPISIDILSVIPQDTTLIPRATVKNFSNPLIVYPTSETASFNVTCEITLVHPSTTNKCIKYIETEAVTDLKLGDSIQVAFPDIFTFESGPYTVTVYTSLASDVNKSNDTLTGVFDVFPTGGPMSATTSPAPMTFELKTASINRGNFEIEFTIPKATKIDLVVYDVLGRLSKTLISKNFSAGTHHRTIELDLPSGVYFCNLKTSSGRNSVQKFLIIE